LFNVIFCFVVSPFLTLVRYLYAVCVLPGKRVVAGGQGPTLDIHNYETGELESSYQVDITRGLAALSNGL
jgi:hypothetical protein